MTVRTINIDELSDYVNETFKGDDDLLFYYDKKEKIKTIESACNNVVEKIRMIYTDSEIRGIKINGSKVGYFVFTDELLISFGLNKGYRNKVILIDMWDCIKHELGDTFQCLLYSHNIRGCDWLKKCGMKELFSNVTIFRYG